MHSHSWNALGLQSSLLQKNSTDRICKYEALQPTSSKATSGFRFVTFLKYFSFFLKNNANQSNGLRVTALKYL